MRQESSLSADHLTSIISQLPGLFWVADRTYKIVAVSEAYLSLIQTESDALQQQEVAKVFAKEPYRQMTGSAAALQASLARVFATGQPDAMPPVQFAGSPSGKRTFSLLNLPVKGADQQVQYVIHQATELPAERADQKMSLQQAVLALTESGTQSPSSDDNPSPMLWTINAQGHAVEDSPSWRACTGQTYEEWKGEGWLNAIHPEDQGYVRESWRQSVRNEVPLDTTFRLRHVSGVPPSDTWRWMAVRAVALRDPEGSVCGWIGMNTDITQRKEAKVALQKSENIYRTLASNLPNGGAFVVDRDLRYVLADGQALGMSGMTSADLEGKTIREAIAPGDVERYELQYRQALAGEPFHWEHQIQDRYYLSRGTPLRDKDDQIYAVLAVSYDITERKMVEEALRVSEERLHLIMESAIDYAIFTQDMHGIITSWNAGAEQLMGYTEEEILGQPGKIVFTSEDRARDQHKFERQRAVAAGRAENERWHVRKDGSRFWGSGLTMPLRDGKNNLQGFLTIMRDHTGRMQMEDDLRHAKEAAEQAARGKEEFLSVMSHEIRTPLNAIVGLSNLLLQQDPKADQMENLQTLKFSAENLMVLVNNILDFSKIQHGKVSLEMSDVDLRTLVNSLQKAHQIRAQEQDTELHFYVDKDIPALIRTDQLKLSQVLHNLIGNAVKFTPDGSVSVEVSMQRREGQRLWIEFSVRDTGIGISKDKLHHIFEKFVQADSSTVRKYGGTGLGLTITKLLLELMGSQIRVESQPDKGSRFFFTLPVRPSRVATPLSSAKIPDAEAGQAPPENFSLLLVEDVYINRMVIRQFLNEWWTLTLDEAVDGEQAIAMVQQKPYDLVLMDVRMPLMDGYEATRLIRSLPDEAYKQMPIIALTADTIEDMEKHGEATLFTDVVTKPFDPATLKQKIVQHTAGKKTRMHSPPLDIAKVETVFEGDALQVRRFLERAAIELTSFREVFEQAVLQRDAKALGSLHHKTKVLLDMLALHDLQTLLDQSRTLLDENADWPRLEALVDREEEIIEGILKTIGTEGLNI